MASGLQSRNGFPYYNSNGDFDEHIVPAVSDKDRAWTTQLHMRINSGQFCTPALSKILHDRTRSIWAEEDRRNVNQACSHVGRRPGNNGARSLVDVATANIIEHIDEIDLTSMEHLPQILIEHLWVTICLT
jgi:hypothetical protein